MAAAYAWADLALCRAGAMTIAEFQAAGLGALMVPFPGADDHQTGTRRRWCAPVRAASCKSADMTPDSLSAGIAELTSGPAAHAQDGRSRRSLRNTDAAARLADLCLAAGGAAA